MNCTSISSPLHICNGCTHIASYSRSVIQTRTWTHTQIKEYPRMKTHRSTVRHTYILIEAVRHTHLHMCRHTGVQHTYTRTHINRQADIHRDRQIDRQTNKRTKGHTDRQKDKHKQRKSGIRADRQQTVCTKVEHIILIIDITYIILVSIQLVHSQMCDFLTRKQSIHSYCSFISLRYSTLLLFVPSSCSFFLSTFFSCTPLKSNYPQLVNQNTAAKSETVLAISKVRLYTQLVKNHYEDTMCKEVSFDRKDFHGEVQ